MYKWTQLRDFQMNPVDNDAGYGSGFEVKMQEIGEIDDKGHDDPRLLSLWEVETPLGENTHMKSDITRYLHWLLMFRTFQRGATRAIEKGLFRGEYKTDDPWYFIVGEHDQMQALVAEYSPSSGLKKPAGFSVSKTKSSYDNIESLVVNSQIEKPCEVYLKWVKEQDEFAEYIDIVEKIQFDELERRVENTLFEQAEWAAANRITVGGVCCEWMNTDESRMCMGYSFSYTKKL